MDLKRMTDDELMTEAKLAIESELSAITHTIRHLQEIYDRELYLKRGFSNMFVMLTTEFKLCNGSAQLRINAMKLIRDVPSVEAKIESGEMSLSVAANVQSFLRAEKKLKRPYTANAKIELVETCTGLSVLEAQKEFVRRNPEIEKRDCVRPTSESTVRVSHSQSLKTEEKIQRIKQLWSHIDPNMPRDEINDRMAEIVLDHIDPIRKAMRAEAIKASRAKAAKKKLETKNILDSSDLLKTASTSEFAPAKSQTLNESLHVHEVNRSRYIKAEDRRNLVLRNNNQGCEFLDDKTGRRCGEKHLEQNDHVIPWSLGGSNEGPNLRRYCANHNRWAWRNRSVTFVRSAQLAYR